MEGPAVVPKGGVREVGRKRETWNNKIDFLLACIGFSVGLGNVWRFPYLCYKNGGGAFLIPYFICVIVGGIPLFFLEVAVGQFMSEGGMKAWNLSPFFAGIGWATTVIVFFLNCYYNVILAWAFYYMFASFTTKLPWDSCDNWWNTCLCREVFGEGAQNNSAMTDMTCYPPSNASKISEYVGGAANVTLKFMDPTTEFWERKVLGISGGIHQAGGIKWDLCLCLIFAWCVVYFCIWKGIRTSGKVMYFTATSPYIFMTILLIRGATLPGAGKGILFYIVPEFDKLANMEVWVDAGTQIFFSYSIALGALTALGSYNKFNHNSYRDSMLFAIANSGTSFFAGFVIFSTIGFMAEKQGVSVGEVAGSGPGLAFIAYPKAVSQMPAAPVWSILFFFMIILLGLDSQFVGVEGLVTACVDVFPWLKKGKRREIFIGVACLTMCLIGLAMVTEGGMYVFQLFDYYTGSRIILLVALFMCIVVSFVYGVDRFYDNLEMMYGFRINPYMKVCWVFCAPVFCITIFIMSAINYSELDYKRPGVYGTKQYIYPDWAVGIGWALACLSIVWVPIVAIWRTVITWQAGKPFTDVFKPVGLKAHQLRPQDREDADVVYTVNQEIEVGKATYDNPGFNNPPSYAATAPAYNNNKGYDDDAAFNSNTTRL